MKNPPISHYLVTTVCLLVFLKSQVSAQSSTIKFIAPILLQEKPKGSITLNTPDMRLLDFYERDSIITKNAENLVIHKNSLYININGTGRIYRLDTAGNAVRVDSTYYQGSTFGAKFLTYNDTLILAGGYGFWHSTGAIRFYKEFFHEWDIYKFKNPIPFSMGLNAYSFWNGVSQKLFLIYTDANPEFTHANTTDNRVKIQAFDFKSKRWWDKEKLLNPEIARSLWELSLVTETEKGLMFNTKNSRESILIDFEKEQIYNVDESVSDNIIQQFNKSQNRIVYAKKDSIKILDLSKNVNYAIPINPRHLKLSKLDLYHNAFQISDYLNLQNILIAGCILSLLVLYINRKKLISKPKAKDDIEASPLNHNMDAFKRFCLGIENEEQLILEVLAKNEQIQKYTTTIELNNKLGIENKPIKIQNNLRATLIGDINKKFNLATTANEELIERVRSDFDKRFFEYKLNSRYAHVVSKFFGND
jgi:hypothetical protein